ncbi:hypothetical protein LC593_24940 [Nostoc sp. CHAB 5844]|nr:hypothetical protein [Nostoc sp. CHAB 5844]
MGGSATPLRCGGSPATQWLDLSELALLSKNPLVAEAALREDFAWLTTAKPKGCTQSITPD